MKRVLLTVSALAGLAGPASADVCSWISQPVAESALTFLQPGVRFQRYCKSCGDAAARAGTVSSSSVKQVNRNYWQVQVNGAGADLAYLFVPDPGNKDSWTNLGVLAKCDGMAGDDAPRSLPANLVAR